MPEKHNNLEYCPGSGQDRVNFAVARRGYGSDPEGYSVPPHVTALLSGWREGSLFQGEGAPFRQVSVAEGAVRSCLLLGVFCMNPSFPVPSVISIVAVIVCFLISLLFAVN